MKIHVGKLWRRISRKVYKIWTPARMYSQTPTDCMHVARKCFLGILIMVNEIHMHNACKHTHMYWQTPTDRMWQGNTSKASWRWLLRFMSACEHIDMYSQTPTDCMHVARKYFWGILMMVNEIYERMRAHWHVLTVTHWLYACGKEILLRHLDDG